LADFKRPFPMSQRSDLEPWKLKCRCGACMTFELRSAPSDCHEQFRLVCQSLGGGYSMLVEHCPIAEWTDSDVEAMQLWRVLQVMAGD